MKGKDEERSILQHGFLFVDVANFSSLSYACFCLERGVHIVDQLLCNRGSLVVFEAEEKGAGSSDSV